MRTRPLARFAPLAAAFVLLFAARAQGQTAPVVLCENCHGSRDFMAGRRGSGDSSLFVPAATLQETAHRGLRCPDCHQGYEAGYPHQATNKVAPCQTCHEPEGREWQASIHAPNAAAKGDAPNCIGCHGSHLVYRTDDRRAPTYSLNVAALCGRCHADPRIIGTYFATVDKAQARTAVAQYYKTVHGHALTTAGLTVSATCNDCHRAHLILPPDSAESSVNRKNIPTTCGRCHVGIVEVYEQSAHGIAERTGRRTTTGHAAPVCVDCHSAHGIVRADQPQWLLRVVDECGTCHERLYQTYFETYHGKVTRLGFTLAATCSDCHTAHDMRPATDPKSAVFPAKRLATCARCHPAANANFVRYQPHGDPKDRARYPQLFWTWLFMTVLLGGVMAFFGLHTVLWLGRLAVDGLRRGRGGSRPSGPDGRDLSR
jgi:nitrate/TMAO reductase-like tetraheme cytochrome c subunit